MTGYKEYASKDWVADQQRNNFILFSEPQDLTDEQREQARANISRYKWHYLNGGLFTCYYALPEDTPLNYEIAKDVMDADGGNATAINKLVTKAAFHIFFHSKNNTFALTNVKPIISNYELLINSGALPGGKKIKVLIGDECDSHVVGDIVVESTTANGATHRISGINKEYVEFEIWYNANSESVIDGVSYSRLYNSDDTLTESSRYATAKAVGDALAIKIDKTDIATDDEIIDILIQEDMFMAVTDSDGSYLSDENGNILLW